MSSPALTEIVPPFVPLGQDILILADDAETTTEHGIEIPTEQAMAARRTGDVVAIGLQCEKGVKVGDHVMLSGGFSRQRKLEFKGFEGEYYCVDEIDVLGVLLNV